jgi:MFS superfamily sulfate permease-like transporter
VRRLRLPHGLAVPGRARRCPRRSAPGVVAYRLYGPLFFAAVAKLEALPDRLPPGTTTLALDAQQLISIDASGLDAFESVHRRWRAPASGWSSSASTSSRSRRCASGASTP